MVFRTGVGKFNMRMLSCQGRVRPDIQRTKETFREGLIRIVQSQELIDQIRIVSKVVLFGEMLKELELFGHFSPHLYAFLSISGVTLLNQPGNHIRTIERIWVDSESMYL
jgi:hypothetical protein